MTENSRYGIAGLLLTGLIFHVVYIGSVFDCYFTSPVVHGMKSYGLGSAEAKRLVLIIGDGLRADLLFNVNAFPTIPESPPVVAPYLRAIAESRGAFGVSHTRVPTESRPGHVALIGGMYEDVSAVTKGWKTNPVDFDSVFNRSSHTFSFGSPDILPMFSRGATPGKVKTWSYDEQDEDFTKDATALDLWVIDELRTLFHNATIDHTLDSQLRSDKVIFFLHLLGLDTTGHSYRPHSKEYMNNIQVVDSIVHETEDLFTKFYNDQETSFVFTADHGMSKIGNHGDGDPDNTRTPLIAWGRGVRGPLPDPYLSSHDDYSAPWNLGHLMRRDVEQADVASLMAALIGIDWPVNCVGVLPDVDPTRPGYLLPRDGNETLARAALVNAKVILEHYRVKHELKRAHTLLYKPFSPLEGSVNGDDPRHLTMVTMIEENIRAGEWYFARETAAELIKTTLEGLRYLQTYDRFLIRGIVTAAYIGWAAYASLFINRPGINSVGSKWSTSQTIVTLTAKSILLISWSLFTVQNSPWTFYLYIAFPCFFWRQFIVHMLPVVSSYRNRGVAFYGKGLFQGALVLGALQCMVAAYTHRSIWSIGFLSIGIIWPLLAWPTNVRLGNRFLLASWAASCLITGIFPLLAVDKTESLRTIMFGGASMLMVGGISVVWILQRIKSEGGSSQLEVSFSGQLFLLGLTMVITNTSVLSLQSKLGLPIFNQISGWIVLVVASAHPFISRIRHPNALSRILTFFLAFAPCFVILSISVEGLFYLAYSATLVLWIEVEATLRTPVPANRNHAGTYHFQSDDLRIAMFFLFFVQVAFFGTGNVASISSFYLEPVYRLVPIFNPFLMAALLIFKIIAPYIILSVSFANLNTRLQLPPFSLFLVALTLTDGMTLTFFFNVTDTGSWLEIGQTISFFCITSLLLVWSAGICAAGELLMATTPLKKTKSP